jgi:16S rRNA (adenine1518-N6/adenine1519-N6)-dimethyltransferase
MVTPHRAKKRLGQHFLESQQIIDRIVEVLALRPGERVIEIGPGLGALTVPLAQTGAELIAIEFDRDVVPSLRKKLGSYAGCRVINADFLTFDPDPSLLPEFILAGNLPYNITSPVMEWCVRHRGRIQRAVFMVQRELGRRIAGRPPGKDWSPLSIHTQLHFDVRVCFDVPPEAFRPPPEVVSSVIELTPHDRYRVDYPKSFERLVRQSFQHRRKLLVNNLAPELLPDSESAAEALEEVGLSRTVRAEQVDIDLFLALTEYLVSRNLLSAS